MGKATKKNDTPKTDRKRTVAYSTAQKVGKEIFKLNPDLKEVHVTSDGTAFYNGNDAQNHARTLADKSVTKVQRIDTPEESAAEEQIQPGGDNTENGVPTEGDEPNDNPNTEE